MGMEATETTETINTTETDMCIEPVPEDMCVTEEMGLVPEGPEAEAAPEPEEQPDQDPQPTDALNEKELKGVLESLLYVSHDPLTLDRLTTVLEGPPKAAVQSALRSLQEDYDQEGRGLQISELAGGYVMITIPDCAPWITKLQKAKASAKVTRSAMETLAIIAYRQPIVRADIEHIRGVETSGVIRTLLEHKLIRMVGRKDVPGRPILYGTSKVFLQRFGLRDLKDLPPLRQFKELGQEGLPFFDVGEEEIETVEEPLLDANGRLDEGSLPDTPVMIEEDSSSP